MNGEPPFTCAARDARNARTKPVSESKRKDTPRQGVPTKWVVALLTGVFALVGRDFISGDEATRLSHARDRELNCMQHEIQLIAPEGRKDGR